MSPPERKTLWVFVPPALSHSPLLCSPSALEISWFRMKVAGDSCCSSRSDGLRNLVRCLVPGTGNGEGILKDITLVVKGIVEAQSSYGFQGEGVCCWPQGVLFLVVTVVFVYHNAWILSRGRDHCLFSILHQLGPLLTPWGAGARRRRSARSIGLRRWPRSWCTR